LTDTLLTRRFDSTSRAASARDPQLRKLDCGTSITCSRSTVAVVSDAVQPNKLRIHLEQRDGTFRTLAQVMFTTRDASLYLVPYARSGNYFYGAQSVRAGQADFEVRFREHVTALARPKLSIHESGDVHIYADESTKAGPINIRPVSEFRGEHI